MAQGLMSFRQLPLGDSLAYGGQSLFHKQFLIIFRVLHPASNITTTQTVHGSQGYPEKPYTNVSISR
jgi:hypothetical protein